MKKDIPYRDQLLELSKLYKIPEVKSYIRSRKNLTTSQLELILLKNNATKTITEETLANRFDKTSKELIIGCWPNWKDKEKNIAEPIDQKIVFDILNLNVL